MTKRQKMEFELQRLNEREEKLQLAKAKKEADLELLEEEKDDFRVKISLADYELLKQAKLYAQANQMQQQQVNQNQQQLNYNPQQKDPNMIDTSTTAVNQL